ncbi:MAG: hypothetical protein DMG50_29095 [Acidobacteria bacterium]|nr:MAG: hypothetical protein DMG50_29095 [Acidobacteriota bacterium]
MVAGTKFHKIWVQHCRATRTIKQQFRVKTALDYLLGKKIVNLAEGGDRRLEFATELLRFQAGLSNVFNPNELAGYLTNLKKKLQKLFHLNYSSPSPSSA